MIIDEEWKEMKRMIKKKLRKVLWKKMGVNIMMIVGMWVEIRKVLLYFEWKWMEKMMKGMKKWEGWIGIVEEIVEGIGMEMVIEMMIEKVKEIIEGFLIDDVEEIVEREEYNEDKKGKKMKIGR